MTSAASADACALRPLNEAVEAILGACAPVGVERVPLSQARGRILAEDVVADRDCPAVDVSAMDGFAVRLADVARMASEGLAVVGEAAMGRDVRELAPATAMRIFTGSPAPRGADVVVKREDVLERNGAAQLLADPASIRPGQHIRRAGENARAGERIVQADTPLSPAAIAALAHAGVVEPVVRRRVRVAVVATGDELVDASASPALTQLRDANSCAVAALFAQRPWIEVVQTARAPDDFDAICDALALALDQADCVVTTGGVSMGEHDYVPPAAARLGARTIAHRLAIKPGKPFFAARFEEEEQPRLLLGLPGNPVSALATARRIALAALAAMAGAPGAGPEATVQLEAPVQLHPSLARLLLVQRRGTAAAELKPNRGSGDVVALGRSDGFVEVAPGAAGAGPFPFYSFGG